MALPDEPRHPYPGNSRPPKRRLRLARWDVICTVATLTLVIVAATTTTLPSRLFGFVADVCAADSCAPAPLGINYWIYPVVWGGLGAACAAAVIGPFVSLVKGWYLFFWPLLAVAIVALSSVAGSVMTAFSEQYGH
ncbi:hypothetical protein BMW24_010690 [Mycobacterium heckeshornense]|uniref:Uncharacterized protein n=2 Tax=Mycobacterium heckeshornense TaxID=110505 RepID=A0A2G8BB26_9MYCO|nr:hypothetical protein [Mycobacterium heckeshornense]KMV17218.1 membrane protein [Mycobacterium heckeshornense]MCV7035075.1 hypothetical protein [Mycobacterium heckeshornense]PIJ34948.1 hypothetical protein BMW24_010690 [Mycobacterium heckeshornense]BCO36144.1 hypothetical protein MHEC_25770 [Mycobacterium heckeshornense]BCQ09292.1 hypothetical protein JMUB5695_02736 [Mycobacterium heckeshornense]